jgi:hypothetical protein
MFWVHTYFFIITLQVRAIVAERSKCHLLYLLQWQMEATAIPLANRSKCAMPASQQLTLAEGSKSNSQSYPTDQLRNMKYIILLSGLEYPHSLTLFVGVTEFL